jgi:hypothetical protein
MSTFCDGTRSTVTNPFFEMFSPGTAQPDKAESWIPHASVNRPTYTLFIMALLPHFIE